MNVQATCVLAMTSSSLLFLFFVGWLESIVERF